jgi:hypothetical protein
MKPFALVVAALALLAGFAGGLRAYSVAAPAQAAPAAVSGSATAPHYPKAMPVKPGATFRWAPCQKPAVREGRACVTQVTRTVTLPPSVITAPPTPVRVAAPAHAAPTRHPSPTAQPTTYHDDGGDDGGEHDDGGGGHDD